MSRQLYQAQAEIRRWASYALSKGFTVELSEARATRPGCKIEFKRGKWAVYENELATARRVANCEMFFAALKTVH